MAISLLDRNIVINGIFEPSFFDRFFFVENKIVSKDEILPASFFNNTEARLLTKKFNLVISLNQLVVYAGESKETDDIAGVLSSILKATNLKIQPNFGFNFDWFQSFEDEKTLRQKSKEYFYNKESKLLSSFFNTDDANYGHYVSKVIDGGKLKLTIRPVTKNDIKSKVSTKGLHYQFNFHFSDTDIVTIIPNYNKYKKMCEEMVSVI